MPFSMLLDFRLRNYKSIHDWQGISWRATGRSKKLLWPHLGLFGANAAGKSNLLEGFCFLRQSVTAPPHVPISTDKYYAPFALRESPKLKASEWEVQGRLADGRSFRYGLAFAKKAIAAEWFFLEEQPCFVREFQTFDIWPSFSDARPLLRQCSPQSSLVAILAHYRVAEAYALQQSIACIQYIDRIPTNRYHPALARLLNDAPRRRLLFKLLEVADMGIKEVQTKPSPPYALRPVDVYIRQDFYTSSGHLQTGPSLPLLQAGGRGMRQLFYYACALLDACWQGHCLIIDNYADALHPNLALALLDLFSQQHQDAQLLFATQQIQLLQEEIFDPEQIYFAEKQQRGHTETYRLADFENLPEAWLKHYLKGRFGALPIVRHWPRVNKWNLFE